MSHRTYYKQTFVVTSIREGNVENTSEIVPIETCGSRAEALSFIKGIPEKEIYQYGDLVILETWSPQGEVTED